MKVAVTHKKALTLRCSVTNQRIDDDTERSRGLVSSLHGQGLLVVLGKEYVAFCVYFLSSDHLLSLAINGVRVFTNCSSS